MASDLKAQAGGRARIAALFEPAADGDEAAQRRARVALTLLAVLVALALVNLAFSVLGAYGDAGAGGAPVAEIAVAGGLAAAFALVRRGHLTAGVVLALAFVEGAILYFHLESMGAPGQVNTLYFMPVPILLAGLLLPVVPATMTAALSMVLALSIELGTHRQAGLVPGDYGLFLLLAATATLSVTGAALYQRDARSLARNEQLLRQVTDNIPEIFFLAAADGSRMHYTSPAYATVTGRTVAQAMADPRDWLKSVHPEDLPGVLKALADRSHELEYRVLHPSGAVKHLRARVFPVQGPAGGAGTIVGLAEDVTAVKEAQRQVREAQAQRIHLLQQLAHDLASPLRPIKLQLHVLAGKLGADAGSLAIVQRNVQHLQRLVEDVKDVARLEGGQLRVERKPTDLARLAREAAETLAATAAERQVQVHVDAPAAFPLAADAGRLTQVLYNLVGNALKFTPPGGRIDVAVQTTVAQAVVTVRDSGGGMCPDQVAKLFRPFSQVHDAGAIKRPEDKGTGLGLYISKGIVEAHGGSIAAASEGPGKGSTFTFRLPLAASRDGTH